MQIAIFDPQNSPPAISIPNYEQNPTMMTCWRSHRQSLDFRMWTRSRQSQKATLCVPLPLPMAAEERPRAVWPDGATSQERTHQICVAFTSFMLDGQPFKEPQTIEPGILRDLGAEVNISRWPDDAVSLVLEPLSIEPNGTYELPTFVFNRPAATPPLRLEQVGRIVVRSPTSALARPLEFAYRARSIPETCGATLTMQGQRHLRVECFGAELRSESRYILVDQKLRDIRDHARRVPAVRDAELHDFLLIMSALGGVAGQGLQDNLFPAPISESQFQKELKHYLRSDRRIGSQLEEHPRAGGGITDLSFKGIRLELKVENEGRISIADASQYFQQVAQYVAGSDRRFGALCILDVSTKTEAPGSVANDIDFQTVTSPAGGLPICIGVVVIRGNLAKPSSFS